MTITKPAAKGKARKAKPAKFDAKRWAFDQACAWRNKVKAPRGLPAIFPLLERAYRLGLRHGRKERQR